MMMALLLPLLLMMMVCSYEHDHHFLVPSLRYSSSTHFETYKLNHHILGLWYVHPYGYLYNRKYYHLVRAHSLLQFL
jgi:hypothetical protein